MLNLDDKKLKCALILGILFFVLSHPYLYRLAHRNLSQVVSFLDAEGCPTELGVLIMALVFVGVVYWGHDELASVKGVANNKKANNGGNNVILNKCRTYCQQVSDEMNQENAMMNNIANTNNNQMANNIQLNMNNQVANNGNVNLPINNLRPTVPAISNQIPNNLAVNNNIQMNQNRMNNAMMNNQLQNNVPVQAPMPSVNLNNASNLGMDNLNTGSSDMGLLNAQSCSDNPQCSGNMNSLVGGQAYDPNLSNMNSGNMFSENTTYHDDMYASLF